MYREHILNRREALTERNFVKDFDFSYREDGIHEMVYNKLLYGETEPEEYIKNVAEAARRYEKEQKLRVYRATEVKCDSI